MKILRNRRGDHRVGDIHDKSEHFDNIILPPTSTTTTTTSINNNIILLLQYVLLLCPLTIHFTHITTVINQRLKAIKWHGTANNINGPFLMKNRAALPCANLPASSLSTGLGSSSFRSNAERLPIPINVTVQKNKT